jgi:putative DNA primase/helicase
MFSDKGWHYQRNGVYGPVSEVEVQGLALQYGEELRNSVDPRDTEKFRSVNGIRGIVALAKTKLGVKGDEFDSDPDLVGCQNGVLNLATGELLQDAGSIVTRRTGV